MPDLDVYPDHDLIELAESALSPATMAAGRQVYPEGLELGGFWTIGMDDAGNPVPVAGPGFLDLRREVVAAVSARAASNVLAEEQPFVSHIAPWDLLGGEPPPPSLEEIGLGPEEPEPAGPRFH